MIEFPRRYRSLPPARLSSSALFRLGAARRCDIGRRRPLVTREFLLGVLDPGLIGLLVHDAHRDRHEGVVLAAQFRALSVIHALARRLEPRLVEAARDRVDLDAE